MNIVDKQYLDLMQDILDNGIWKETRSGKVKSVFGRMMRFNLKDGFPLLTTKKMFYKGMIYELLWFLKSDTNIKYLVDNNVHIWDADAYRYYVKLINEHNSMLEKYKEKLSIYEIKHKDILSKDDFIDNIKNEILDYDILVSEDKQGIRFFKYKLGDLGAIYGHQWRNWNGIDQIKNVIETLKLNPNDRRMIVSAWNVSELDTMALPPCHYNFQFYTRELSFEERLKLLSEVDNSDLYEQNGDWKPYGIKEVEEDLIKYDIPKYELSCLFNMRSNDFCLGNPYNISQYALLTHMISQCVNMTVGELIYNGGDVHIYENQIEGCTEQLSRDPFKYDLPKLWLNPEIKDIDSFTYDDIKILDYESYPTIKFPLSVGQ